MNVLKTFKKKDFLKKISENLRIALSQVNILTNKNKILMNPDSAF